MALRLNAVVGRGGRTQRTDAAGGAAAAELGRASRVEQFFNLPAIAAAFCAGFMPS